jgi:hypothetical protein
MLRLILLMLLLANAGFWAWSQGWLAPIGMAPLSQHEPERLQQQVAESNVRIAATGARAAASRTAPKPNASANVPAAAQPASAASAAAAAASSVVSTASSACQQTALLDAATASATETALGKALPAKPWKRLDEPTSTSAFAVAMTGLNAATVQVKQGELQRLSIATEPLRGNGGAVVGLILGRYNDRAQADAALAAYGRRGVRTARVVTGIQAPAGVRLRIDPVSDDVANLLRGWNAQAAEVAVFRSCAS